MDEDKVAFSAPLKFLHIIGLNPFNFDKFSCYRRNFSVLIFTTSISLGLMELILHFQGLETLARASDTMVPQYQLVWKIAVLITHKNKLKQLINDCGNFWILDKFGEKFQTELIQSHKFLNRFFLTYKIIIIFTCCQFIVVKIVFKQKAPVAIAFGENEGLQAPYDQLYLILHSFTTLIAINLLIGFDGLFFFIIGHILTELKMVSLAFSTIEICTLWSREERFKLAIKHHSYILKFIHDFNDVFSSLLLMQHLSCLFGICFGLLLLSKDGIPPDIDKISKYSPFIITFAIQTWTFSFAGSLLMDWSARIPNVIFYNSWIYDGVCLDKFGVLIAMQRGQKHSKLSLGGFGNLDLESFTLVMKNAFSFFTFMNTINGVE